MLSCTVLYVWCMKKQPGGFMVIGRIVLFVCCSLLAACAGNRIAGGAAEGYVEIVNPASTMTDNAPQTIWVPRSYVESGLPKGSDLVKGIESMSRGGGSSATKVSTATSATAAGITGVGGKAAVMIPRFGMVVALDGERIYINVGKDDGVAVGQVFQLYRGGTVVEGLGLAPGAMVGKVEIGGYVGTRGAYGLLKQGGSPRVNDLVGLE